MALHDLRIVDSTLREGEQFARALHQSPEARDRPRARCVRRRVHQLTNPSASPSSFDDARMIAGLGMRARVLVHCRCTLEDARRAVATGAHGVNVLFGTSQQLREHSHGRSVPQIIAAATEVITYLQSEGVETRFSCEDAFRTPIDTLLEVYRAVDALGVDRVGYRGHRRSGGPYGGVRDRLRGP